MDTTLKLHDSLSIDIRNADDTILLSAIFEKLYLSTSHLENASQKLDRKINGAKCQVISPSDQRIIIDGEEVELVEEFVFLGSVVPNSAKDVIRRMGLASTAFG